MTINNKLLVGEMAKLANVSVRTLQYYDKIGLLKPSEISEGGRRIYNSNDISIIHQIITLKSLGLSLKDIGKRIIPINSNNDIVHMLDQQSKIIKEQISKANKTVESIEMIKREIIETNQVDWAKYSNMVKLINDNNEYYWVINFLDKDILTSITETHELDENQGMSPDWLKKCLEKAVLLDKQGVSPESVQGQEIANEWWRSVMKYTKGDSKLLEKLYKFYSGAGNWPAEFGEIQKKSQLFLEKAIEYFMKEKNINSLLEE
ncbi:HTH-type transcriptional activator TipA [Candidatus Izimaplasma bacterium HR1]|jgi:DNA-binding transcriptional MerR regulator|uniref:MerR family transcriptional regulator n=1 Tax=Candidatus Izimoplasma sp. HR1 TaxID=1541959 RepID=UPI0004F71E9B|nr:HTH-type transcriptional activator TipA [Candidatus Izimaplasma bacterium HR1]